MQRGAVKRNRQDMKNDILGQAMTAYHQRRSTAKLWVNNRYGPREEMPVKIYFRNMADMPELEWLALQQCRGKILDIGAGAGSHALALQHLGQRVTALDVSPMLAALMESRGVKKVLCQDFFKLRSGKYDTLLLLMNGIGLSATLDGLRHFLKKARLLLRPGGQLLFDSSDIAYLYRGKPPRSGEYYGAIFYQYQYRGQQSNWFQWLFIDPKTLRKIATEEGWEIELLYNDGRDHYLVRCRLKEKKALIIS
jgi:SAM-dependent methyltransferase